MTIPKVIQRQRKTTIAHPSHGIRQCIHIRDLVMLGNLNHQLARLHGRRLKHFGENIRPTQNQQIDQSARTQIYKQSARRF